MSKWNRFCIILTLLLLLASIVACTPSVPSVVPTATPAPAVAPAPPTSKPAAAVDKPLQPPVKVKYGHLAGSLPSSGIFIAVERGYFKEQGLDVEATAFKSAPDLFPGIASGDVLAGSSAPNAGLFNAILRGINARIVAGMSTTSPGNTHMGIVVRKDLYDDGVIKGYPDLKGKSIGVTGAGGGGTGEKIVNFALQKGNLSSSDASLQNLAFPDLLPALSGKTIDAALNMEPNITQGVEQGVFVPWKWGGEILPPNHQDVVMMYSEKFGKENPDAARRFMIAYLKGARDYNDAFYKGKDKAQIAAIIAKYLGMKDPSILQRTAVTPMGPNGELNTTSLVEHVNWNLQKGYIKEKLDIDSVVDRQWVEYAVQKLGTYN